MKRYIMFRGCHYAGGGGLQDVVCCGDSIEECMEGVNVDSKYEWVHFLDTSTGERVEIYSDGREVRESL
jgi:hypothetical protein